jgi:hypothetical protein
MTRLTERTHRKPIGLLIWGKDRHDILRKATELQGKFRVHEQRLAVEKAKYYGDIVYLDKRYKQYEIPIVPVRKGTKGK